MMRGILNSVDWHSKRTFSFVLCEAAARIYYGSVIEVEKMKQSGEYKMKQVYQRRKNRKNRVSCLCDIT